jgi:hypothetical protein
VSAVATQPTTLGPAAGPATEVAIARHLAKLGLWAAPVALVFSGLLWGMNGVWSCALGIALVLVNYALSALLISSTARISLALMMGAVLFGFLLRLGLIALAVWWAKDQSWVNLKPLCFTIVVTHLGLLFWEMKFISASLAFPGHKPAKETR